MDFLSTQAEDLSRRVNMFSLPHEVICTGILTLLSVRELQALDTAVTNTYLRPQVRNLWKTYSYESQYESTISNADLKWLCGAGVTIVGVNCTSFDMKLIKRISSHTPNLIKLSATLNKKK